MRSRLGLLVPCALLALAASAAANTLKVPSQFPTIGAALLNAGDGDTISVSKGTYLESITVDVPNVKLVGKKATIDANYLGNCISVSANGVSISGFTLINGADGVQGFGGEVAAITISKCVISSCDGSGIAVDGGAATITGNTITACADFGIFYNRSLPGHAVIDKNVCLRNVEEGITVSADDIEITHNRCDRNGSAGIDVFPTPVAVDSGLEAPSVVVDDNDCAGNKNDGILVFDDVGTAVEVKGNDCTGNELSGLDVDSTNADIEGNHCDENAERGLFLAIDHSQVTGNTASGNRLAGLLITGSALAEDGGISTGSSNQVAKNTANDNGGDGINLDVGSNNSFSGNKCSGNGDDGLDIDSNSCDGTTVDGNVLSDNAHEGLDNGGTNSVITKNTCKGNAAGTGPDIAGTGDGGLGSVTTFDGNKFDTGGAETPARLDNYTNTSP